MAKKRMLLEESKETLETDLKESFKQDLKRKRKINRQVKTTSTYKHDIQLYNCRGWRIHNNSRIWIQAKAHIE